MCFVSVINRSFTLSTLSPIWSIKTFCLSTSLPMVNAICFWLLIICDNVSSPLSCCAIIWSCWAINWFELRLLVKSFSLTSSPHKLLVEFLLFWNDEESSRKYLSYCFSFVFNWFTKPHRLANSCCVLNLILKY